MINKNFKFFDAILLIVVFVVLFVLAFIEQKQKKEKEAQKEAQRVAFCAANAVEYRTCSVDEDGKEITPFIAKCKKEADEITELNIKKLERKMGVLESQYNICQAETLRLASARINDHIEQLNMVNSQKTKCEEIAAEYNNLKDERGLLVKKRTASVEFVKNYKNKCSFDLLRFRTDCVKSPYAKAGNYRCF